MKYYIVDAFTDQPFGGTATVGGGGETAIHIAVSVFTFLKVKKYYYFAFVKVNPQLGRWLRLRKF